MRYQINYVIDPDLRRFFAIDVDTGLIYVEFTTGAVLDRWNKLFIIIVLIDKWPCGLYSQKN